MKADVEKIGALVAQVAREERVEVYDLDIVREGPRTMVRIFLDREGGIRLGECESFSRKMSAALDVHDPFPGSYVLEVSSPGLTRKLTKPAHFKAMTGRRIKVTLSEPLQGSRVYKGDLVRADEEGIDLDLECGGGTVRLPYGLMRKANREVSQEELFGKGKKKR